MQLTSSSRFYITASTADTHRVLKIDRTDPTQLSVVEDATAYDDSELDLLLRMVQDGNKSQGGLEKVLEFQCVKSIRGIPENAQTKVGRGRVVCRMLMAVHSGIVGFVRFTAGWYLILITKRSVVGLLGGHYSEFDLPP